MEQFLESQREEQGTTMITNDLVFRGSNSRLIASMPHAFLPFASNRIPLAGLTIPNSNT